MLERADAAAVRDHQAALRDTQAAARDRTAELRDLSSDAHERAMGLGAEAAKARATAAEDRARAAEDRARAGQDRRDAALDRERARAELERAQLDDLTGFYRLGLGRAVVQREIDRIRRSDGRLILAYCDVDGLKRVNDEEGHAAGDLLLQTLADAIRSRLRSYDPVVRVGGDEFVCALSEVDLQEAAGIFEDIQTAFAKARPSASLSVGLAVLNADDSFRSLLDRSDQALREARLASP
jgi:diguanylate cyclase (GGDEF)-like protein